MDFPIQRLSRIIWQIICHLAAIAPTGVLIGTAFVLSMPLNNQAEIVAAALLLMSIAITILIHRTNFWKLHFFRVAMFAALGYTVVKTPRLMEASSLRDELVSCLKEYGVMMAVLTFAIANVIPDAPARQALLESATAAVNTAFDDAGPTGLKPGVLPLGILTEPRIGNIPPGPGTLEKLSELGSEYFQGMGPKSRYSFLSSTDDLILSSADMASQRLTREVDRLVEIVNQASFFKGRSPEEAASLTQVSLDVEALTVAGSETIQEGDTQARDQDKDRAHTSTPALVEC